MQQDQGHGVVLHDQGEDHQQPITYRSGSESRQVSTYECWGSVQQVLRPHPFTNVGSFWNSLLFLGGGPIPYYRLDPPIYPQSSLLFLVTNPAQLSGGCCC